MEAAENTLALLRDVQFLDYPTAVAIAVEILQAADLAGSPPTEADVIQVAREAKAAGDQAVALRLLNAARADGFTPNLALYLLAAEAAAAAGDRGGALGILDEADWAVRCPVTDTQRRLSMCSGAPVGHFALGAGPELTRTS